MLEELSLWCLKPLSTIYQLCRGEREKTTCLPIIEANNHLPSQIIDQKISNINLEQLQKSGGVKAVYVTSKPPS
jgi:hypothetical protein